MKTRVFIKYMNDQSNKKDNRIWKPSTTINHHLSVTGRSRRGWTVVYSGDDGVSSWSLPFVQTLNSGALVEFSVTHLLLFGGEWEWSEIWNKLMVALFWYCIITSKHWKLESNKLNVAAISTSTKTGPFGDNIAWVPVICDIITLCSFMHHQTFSLVKHILMSFETSIK